MGKDKITARVDPSDDGYLVMLVNGTQFTYGLQEVFEAMSGPTPRGADSALPCPECGGLAGRHFLSLHSRPITPNR